MRHGERRATIAACSVLAAMLGTALAVRVRAESVPLSVRECRSQVDAAQRLRCYDAAVDGATRTNALQPTPTASPSAVFAAPVPHAALTPAAAPVAPVAAAPAAPVAAAPVSPAASPIPPASIPMFKAKVSDVGLRPSGAVNVTLDNGQVWAQYGPQGRVPLRAGDSVTLRPGMFGATLLVGPSGWITKVHLLPGPAADSGAK